MLKRQEVRRFIIKNKLTSINGLYTNYDGYLFDKDLSTDTELYTPDNPQLSDIINYLYPFLTKFTPKSNYENKYSY